MDLTIYNTADNIGRVIRAHEKRLLKSANYQSFGTGAWRWKVTASAHDQSAPLVRMQPTKLPVTTEVIS